MGIQQHHALDMVCAQQSLCGQRKEDRFDCCQAGQDKFEADDVRCLSMGEFINKP